MSIYVISTKGYADAYYGSIESAVKGLICMASTETEKSLLEDIKPAIISNLTNKGVARVGYATITEETVID